MNTIKMIRDLRTIRALGITSLAIAALLMFGGVASTSELDHETSHPEEIDLEQVFDDLDLDELSLGDLLVLESILDDAHVTLAEATVVASILDDAEVNIGNIEINVLQDFLNDNTFVLTDILNDNDLLGGNLLGNLLGGGLFGRR